MKHTIRIAALLIGALTASQTWAAADACTSFKWDVAREVALYHTTATPLAAGAAVDKAPVIQTERLYQLELPAQETVRFSAPPSKKMLPDGAHAGVLKLNVAQAGQYRLAIDSGFWLDVLRDGKPLTSLDFNGSQECDGPHKIVVYELPAGTDLYVQMSGASKPQVRLTVTRVTASAK